MAVAGGRTHIPFIEARRTALLVVDMQVGFIEPGWPMTIPGAILIAPNINRIAAASRSAGSVVVMLRHSFADHPGVALAPWHARAAPRAADGSYVLAVGAAAHSVHRSIGIEADDLLIDKYRFSAFHRRSSTLAAQLNSRGVDTVIVTGVATNVCCESTARDAQMNGFRVIFVSDATATFTKQEHSATLVNLGRVFADVRSTREVLALLAGRGSATAYDAVISNKGTKLEQ